KLLHPDHSGSSCSTPAIERLIEAYSGLSALYRTGKHGTAEGSAANHTRPGKSSMTDVFALGELSASSTDPAVRACAVEALGKSGRRTAFAYVRKSLHDAESLVVCAAVQAVRLLRIQQAGGELAAVYSKNPAAVRHEILRTLDELGPVPGSESVLALAVQDQDTALRSKAQRIQLRFRTIESDLERMRRMA
ncbi:MAG: HEAT repeat domain-containing protein, partial [Spirochaeta sp.]